MNPADDQRAERPGTIVPPSPLGRRRVAILLAAILLLGAFLRVYRVTELEPGIWDEGCYLLEARFLSTFTRAVWRSGETFLEEKRTKRDLWKRDAQFQRIREETRGEPPRYGRILHDTLAAAADLLVGERPWTGDLVNALFGTLTILWVFYLGRLMYDDRIGLYAALIFSVMGYHVHYSRSWLAEADTLFFIVPAFAFYYRSRLRKDRGNLTAAGLFLGTGFTAHNRCIVILALIILLEILFSRGGGTEERREAKSRVLLLLACFLLPSVLWESFYHVVLLAFRRLAVVMTTPTYLEQVLHGFWHSLLWGYISQRFPPAGFLTFPYLYLHMDGLAAFLLLLAGLFVAWRRRGLADKVLGAWFLFPFVLYSTTSAGLTRFFSMILPPAAVLSAATFFPGPSPRAHRSRGNSLAALGPPLVLLVVAATAVRVDWTRVIPPATGYGKAMAFLDRKDPAARLIATAPPLLQVYAGVDRVAKPPATMEELEGLYRKGHRYYVIDYNRTLYTYYQMNRVEVMDRVSGALDPIFSCANPFILRHQNAFEGNLYFWKTIRMLERGREEKLDRIRIYDLAEFFPPRGAGETGPEEDRATSPAPEAH